MTLTIELTPEEEVRLKQEAQQSGLDVRQYARQRLGLELPAVPLSVAEWQKAFTDWVTSHDEPANRPVVEFSREALYEDCL